MKIYFSQNTRGKYTNEYNTHMRVRRSTQIHVHKNIMYMYIKNIILLFSFHFFLRSSFISSFSFLSFFSSFASQSNNKISKILIHTFHHGVAVRSLLEIFES